MRDDEPVNCSKHVREINAIVDHMIKAARRDDFFSGDIIRRIPRRIHHTGIAQIARPTA
jgi:hypothetical protein